MERTKTRTLLPQGLPPGAKISHKTGDIGSMVGDTGIITEVGGGKYIIAIQVQRPHNDRRANELVRKLSGITYNGFAFAAGQAGEIAKTKDPATVKIGNHPSVDNSTAGSDLLKTEPRVKSDIPDPALP
jgi:beta-lactamase class A